MVSTGFTRTRTAEAEMVNLWQPSSVTRRPMVTAAAVALRTAWRLTRPFRRPRPRTPALPARRGSVATRRVARISRPFLRLADPQRLHLLLPLARFVTSRGRPAQIRWEDPLPPPRAVPRHMFAHELDHGPVELEPAG